MKKTVQYDAINASCFPPFSPGAGPGRHEGRSQWTRWLELSYFISFHYTTQRGLDSDHNLLKSELC